MVCPYNRKSTKYIRQVKNDLEESGNVKGYDEAVAEEYALMECCRENCGVWHDDKCNYNQGMNG